MRVETVNFVPHGDVTCTSVEQVKQRASGVSVDAIKWGV